MTSSKPIWGLLNLYTLTSTMSTGANQPIHWFLGGKGLGILHRNEYMGWFAQINNTTLCNATPSLIPLNPKERTCLVEPSLLVVTFPSCISQTLTSSQPTQKMQSKCVLITTSLLQYGFLCFSILNATPRSEECERGKSG